MTRYKNIPGFPGYRAGSDGSIWSRWCRQGCGWRYGTKPILGQWKMLKPFVTDQGYLRYTLVVQGKRRLVFGHVLILEAFVGPRPQGLEVRHFPDRTRANNSVSNLSWATKSRNAKDRAIHGTTCKGEKSSGHILRERDVRTIRERRLSGESYASIARDYKVSDRCIRNICSRKSWGHI